MSYPSPSEPKSAILSTKKPQSLPWSHQETIHLIQAYQEKWYALKRGQLKASQWEEVAITVAARCGLADDEAKSAIQCRHKMEKLRRRYRSERQGLGGRYAWPYYHAMDALEREPLPISVRPFENHKNPKPMRKNYDEEEEDHEDLYDVEDEEEEEEDEEGGSGKSHSINYILTRPTFSNRFSGFPEKRRRGDEEEEEEEEEAGEVALAAEIRRFAERVVGMERRRMEMTREMERWRMEMEKRRMEMILNSERKILEAIGRRE